MLSFHINQYARFYENISSFLFTVIDTHLKQKLHDVIYFFEA